jgi:hypothetical protein
MIRRDGKGDGIALEPLGFAYGDLAVRIETDQGPRDFVVHLEEPGGVDAHDSHGHCVTLDPDAASVEKLRKYRLD